MPVRVAINGFGTVGERVADEVAKQPDMEIVGGAKTRPNHEAQRAMEKGYPPYITGSGRAEDFEAAGLSVAGTIHDLLKKVEIVVDAAPDRVISSAPVAFVCYRGTVRSPDAGGGHARPGRSGDAGSGKRSTLASNASGGGTPAPPGECSRGSYGVVSSNATWTRVRGGSSSSGRVPAGSLRTSSPIELGWPLST